MIARLAALLAVCALPVTGQVALAQVAEPDGYRMDEFRAPVPATLHGATVVETEAAEALWRDGGAVFVDVLPRPQKPSNLPAGTIWRDKPHDSIPGAIWLPNVGYGALAAVTDAYFRDGLARATGDDRARPVVFFCLRDCWMSWNAARRALNEYGYEKVYWYPDGADGWTEWMLPVERITPR